MSGSILIVEDDDAIRNVLQLTLEFEGYDVNTASNGKEGLSVLSRIDTPCLVFLDLMMPVMDGLGFARALDKKALKIPIVVITAYSDKEKKIQNASLILKKPIDLDLLLKTAFVFCKHGKKENDTTSENEK
jgi:two-component system response regulator MprA